MEKKLKKIMLILFVFLLGICNVKASSNTINSIRISIELDKKGNARVKEIWNMNVKEGTEVYKSMTNLGNSDISNFKVQENGKVYDTIDWDIDASFDEKKYKSGLHSVSGGYELCWGMSKYGNHTYEISYNLSDFVSNVEDKQMIYWKLVNNGMDPAPKKVYIDITAPFSFEDTIPVWGYGYKGYAYIKDGIIHMETEDSLSKSQYMVILAKFEPNTFDTSNDLEGTFDEWLDKAEEGTFDYDYGDDDLGFIDIVGIIFSFGIISFSIVAIAAVAGGNNGNGIPGKYDFKEKGKNFKDVNYFRDIPCNKDIYRAYFIATLYGLTKKKTDFLGSNLLKWLNEGRVKIIKTPAKLFKKEENSISLEKTFNETDLKKKNTVELEKKLYDMLCLASKDNVLEKNEFGKWCNKNYSKVLNWFDDVLKSEKKFLIDEGKLVNEIRKKYKIFNNSVYVIDNSLREEAEQLAGLKKFLIDFSDMKHKEAIEVHLWKEYLMFAQIFGIADKVAKQFKNLYPDVITDVDYSSVIFVNNVSYYGVSRATSARSAAESYSSGGGGFSSGGGGGGSFGGGFGGGTR